MLRSDNHLKLQAKHISDIIKGDIIANLGEVLEVEQHNEHVNFVIKRLNEKQVLKFEADMYLILIDRSDYERNSIAITPFHSVPSCSGDLFNTVNNFSN